MSTLAAAEPAMLALFEKQVDGDDALLMLARLRMEQAGLGAEIHAADPAQLAALLRYRPRVAHLPVVHLPRDLDLLSLAGQRLVSSMAFAGKGAVRALVVHDQPEAVTEQGRYRAALRALDVELGAMADSPLLCIEYAIGLEPLQFAHLIEGTSELQHVGACVDIGHVGVARARRVFASVHPGRDLCSWNPSDPQLPEVLEDVQAAVKSGRQAACELVGELSAMDKLMHLHLHDAHPLSTSSAWGVSDHLSFLEPIALPFEVGGRWSVDTMFGPVGLVQVLERALVGGDSTLSFTLEIHPTQGRRPLGDADGLFSQWRDLTNAERMNQWLFVLQNNYVLLRAAYACVAKTLPATVPPRTPP